MQRNSLCILLPQPTEFYIMVFGVVTSDGDVMPPFIFAQTQHGGLHQKPSWGITAQNCNGGCWKTLHLATRLWTMPHKQEKRVLVIKSFLAKLPLRFEGLTPQIVILLIIVWNPIERETNKTPSNTKFKLKARVTAAFINSKRMSERLLEDSKIV